LLRGWRREVERVHLGGSAEVGLFVGRRSWAGASRGFGRRVRFDGQAGGVLGLFFDFVASVGVGDDEERGAIGAAHFAPDGPLIGLELATADLAGEFEAHERLEA
jgi:hypothetical protein